MTKYCVDCKYHSCNIWDANHMCQHPAQGYNSVTGKLRTTNCWFMKSTMALCDNGKLFEPKITLKQRFMARLNWWLCRDFDSKHLKNFN